MYSLNRATLLGYVGQEPELKYTDAGTPVVNFTIATTERWKDKDDVQQERTTWHNITAWRKLAEVCGEWVKKGMRIYLEGKLETQSWEKDGTKHFKTVIVADQIIMLGAKTESAQATAETAKTEDELPF